MKKAQVQYRQLQSQPAAWQVSGAAVASSQSRRSTQLEMMAEGSQQVKRQRGLAEKISASAAMTAQCKLIDKITSNAYMTPQRVEDENLLQGKFEAVQRIEEEDEELLQGKFATKEPSQLKAESAPSANNTGLPDNLKSGIESLSGISMDNVKVHYNSAQPAQLNALAYAQGTDIHVAPGQEQHLPHEAWHVVQQAQGRVRPTMQMKDGVAINDDKGLEHEADVMGAKAVQMQESVSGTAVGVTLQNHQTAQLQSYSKTVIRPTVFDENNWPGTLSAGGSAADGAIASKVNETLTEMGWGNFCMSAHMIPNRLGGKGNNSNVRPWWTGFEGGKWETDVEQVFNTKLKNASPGASLEYKVDTTDLGDSGAKTLLTSNGIAETESDYGMHKDRLKKIPVDVTATVGGDSKGPYAECFPVK